MDIEKHSGYIIVALKISPFDSVARTVSLELEMLLWTHKGPTGKLLPEEKSVHGNINI